MSPGRPFLPEPVPELPFLRYVGLMATLRCPVACPHCIVRAGPHRTEELPLAEARDWIRQVAAYREGWVKALGVTGGEPFCNLDLLGAIAEEAAAAGLVLSVATNAFWAPSRQEAIGVLEALPCLGVLTLSTDLYHLVSIPLDRIRNAADACDACDVPWSVSVCTQDEQAAEHLALMDRVLEFAPRDRIDVTYALPMGRALTSLDRSRYPQSTHPPVCACMRGGAPVIFPDGRVLACIGPIIDLPPGHPLEFGSLTREPLAAIFDRAETNVLLHALRMWGPRHLIGMLRGAGLGEHLQETYIRECTCDACYNLLANPALAAALGDIARDPAFAREVAYARAVYVQEGQMLQALGLLSTSPPA
jgi:hypothetical protein